MWQSSMFMESIHTNGLHELPKKRFRRKEGFTGEVMLPRKGRSHISQAGVRMPLEPYVQEVHFQALISARRELHTALLNIPLVALRAVQTSLGLKDISTLAITDDFSDLQKSPVLACLVADSSAPTRRVREFSTRVRALLPGSGQHLMTQRVEGACVNAARKIAHEFNAFVASDDASAVCSQRLAFSAKYEIRDRTTLSEKASDCTTLQRKTGSPIPSLAAALTTIADCYRVVEFKEHLLLGTNMGLPVKMLKHMGLTQDFDVSALLCEGQMALYRASYLFDRRHGKFSSYACAAIFKAYSKYLRKRSRSMRRELTNTISPSTDRTFSDVEDRSLRPVSSNMQDLERRALLDAAIAQLPPLEAKVLKLRYQIGKSASKQANVPMLREVAKELQISTSHAGKLENRAKAFLRGLAITNPGYRELRDFQIC